jgi:hypothetical protein
MSSPSQSSILIPEPLRRRERPSQAEALPAAEPEEWLRGLSMRQAEELLDQMERQGQPALALTFDEATGFAVRCR